jgi:molybdenum cofactor biosynthesis enzyme MoaA
MPNLQISTLSVMAGTTACQLRCPFCISKQTYRVKPQTSNTPTPQKTPVSPDKLAFIADKFYAVKSGIPYGIITGKGEPTLAPKEEIGDIIDVLANLYGQGRGLVPELQTNGVLLTPESLRYWQDKGLNTVAISAVSHDDKINSKIMARGRTTWKLANISQSVSDLGLLLRLTVTLCKGGVDSIDSFIAFLNFAREVGVKQVTFREMGVPRNLALPGSQKVANWVKTNHVPLGFIFESLEKISARENDSLPWSRKFSWEGLSVVIAECLTPPKDGLVRSGIIQPDGHLYGSWDDPADILV